MKCNVRRFSENPILNPRSIEPSQPGLEVVCLLNPGAFKFQNKIWLIGRVAERPIQKPGRVSFPIMEDGKIKVMEFDQQDPDLDTHDPREFKYKGEGYLSTMSHLRLLCSDDGVNFVDAKMPPLLGIGEEETFGIEDCRVATMNDGRYVLTYSAVSVNGYGIGMRITRDWKSFEHHGMVISPSNKDGAVFEEKIGDHYWMIHRPSGVIVGGHYMWISKSKELTMWGDHRFLAKTRAGMWDSSRVGAGGSPIKTDAGWLVLYHGADDSKRYCLGAMVLDLKQPWKVIARSKDPILEPEAEYEKTGFFGNVVFNNGHVVNGDEILMYYGAADTVIGGAKLSIKDVLKSMNM